MLNYRHAFHAGNFADLVKHALLLAALERLTRSAEPLRVVDTHAGAGMYDLAGEASRRSGEAQAGVARLMAEDDAPEPLRALAAAVTACNPGGELRRYPGSPWLATRALRPGDAYLGCELRADDAAALRARLAPWPHGVGVEVLEGDGYVEAARRLVPGAGRTLLLVDPPYERADDYARVADLVARRPGGPRQPALIWTPLKDLQTLDGFLLALEAGGSTSLVVAQARLRPLGDPLRMNGCVLAMVDMPDLMAEARQTCDWICAHLGEAGAGFRVERLVG